MLSKFDTFFYKLSRNTFELLMRILFRIRVYGRENFPEPPFIVTSNHTSLLDPPLVGMSCKKYVVNFMAKKELFDSPVIGAWTRHVGCIEVHRGGNSIRSLKEAIRRLKDGNVVGIFPEGTRSEDGTLQDAKRGIGFLIASAGVPVVPCYVSGAAMAFPKGKGIAPGTLISVYIGEPIPPAELTSCIETGKKDYEKIAEKIMVDIAKLKEKVESSN